MLILIGNILLLHGIQTSCCVQLGMFCCVQNIKIVQRNFLINSIFFVGRFRKRQFHIRPVPGEDISTSIVLVTGGIEFLGISLHLIKDNLQVVRFEFLVKALLSLFVQIGDDIRNCCESSGCYIQPLVGVGSIFFIILCYFCYVGTETKCSDGNHRVVRRSVNLTLTGHLGGVFVFCNFCLVDIIQGVILHNLIGHSHMCYLVVCEIPFRRTVMILP